MHAAGLLHNFMHNRVVHQHIVLLTVVTSDSARVSEKSASRSKTWSTVSCV